MKRLLLFISFALACTGLFGLSARADGGPDYWQVTGVAANDHLNIRSGPGTANQIVAIAPNGAVFRNLGCRGAGSARWCHVETPDGHSSGWVSGRFLRETGAPGSGSGGTRQVGVPELYERSSGEIELRFPSGCTVLYNPAGRVITAGGSCSRAQRSRADDAVARHMREQGNHADHSGGSAPAANVNVSGNGTIYGGGALNGRIFGHKEGAYAVTISGDGMTCTGLFKHAPGTVRSETASLHCTDGAHGTAVLVRNRSGNGNTLTMTLTNGTGGYVLF
ncbi:peptide-binding protein [Thioclava dalianensis]|uniref:Peptide-binding protein n=1 Tax=Thioclava dalianensis TaxID=1185766 RepID=A0A074U2H7_9RHOB|nr:SH3 domain-containing protein [Thioclava dalianensis]KEP68852.1 peptide-binding protein [Thioclava dalianensis]SFN22566.1 SH3 domain-containing protein [Thioclava dalianensis]